MTHVHSIVIVIFCSLNPATGKNHHNTIYRWFTYPIRTGSDDREISAPTSSVRPMTAVSASRLPGVRPRDFRITDIYNSSTYMYVPTSVYNNDFRYNTPSGDALIDMHNGSDRLYNNIVTNHNNIIVYEDCADIIFTNSDVPRITTDSVFILLLTISCWGYGKNV